MVDVPDVQNPDDVSRYIRMANSYAARGAIEALHHDSSMPGVPEPKQKRGRDKHGNKRARKTAKRIVSRALARARGKK